MTTPEPVPSAPDTEGLRQAELWSVLDWSLWGNGLGDVLRTEMADVMIAALSVEQREQAEACIKAWHERRSPSMAVGVGTRLQQERDALAAEVRRLKEYLLARRNALAGLLGQPATKEDTGWFDLCSQVAEREAGLRSDLDQARAERDALSEMLRGMARRLGWMRSDCGDNLDAALTYKRERDEARAELARVSGDRTIPTDAAERLACALFRVARTPFQDSPEAPLNNLGLPLWRHQWRDLSDKQRAEWVGYANKVLPQVLADLGATPTTPAADRVVPSERLRCLVLDVYGLGRDHEADDAEFPTEDELHAAIADRDADTAATLHALLATPTTGPAPAAADGGGR